MDHGGNRQTAGAVPDAIDALTRSIHLAMVVCGMAALMSGQFAGDYKSADHGGFVIHRWCGIAMALVMLVYVARGLSGAAAQRFSSWIPFNRRRLQSVWQDVLTLTRLQLPERPLHGGLAGLVQTAGLAAFGWMALSGALLFFWLEPGSRATGTLRLVKKLHEAGEMVVWCYLALHAGAVFWHAVAGRPLWRSMFCFTLLNEKKK
jgi:cytochrome b561